jgi:hypothetical protein
MKVRRASVIAFAAGLVVTGLTSAAQAAGPVAGTCSGGDIASGTYSSLTVTGQCTVPEGASITILHKLKIRRGAMFDAQGAPSDVSIGGSVIARRGSLFGLGCTPAHGCETGTTFSHASVGRNIILHHVYDAAINGVEVGGNVVSHGGGAGFVLPGDFVPFSVKDDVIHGNLIVSDLTTTWFGVIRSTIDGNVILRRIHLDDPDGNEIVHNTIGKNLVCRDLDPAPQLGDAVEGAPPDYGYSTVGGRAIGQCEFVLAPTS